jgi:hypothetical protein
MVLANIVMTNIIVGIILTVIVLVLSLVTISKGYGFKHSIDKPPVNKEDQEGLTEEKDKEDEDK